MKSSRRRSPVQSRKHGERGEKSGGGGGSSSSGTSFLGTPNAGAAVGSNTHLSPAASNLTLPATPSTQSLFSASEDRNHANPMSALPNLTGSLEASTASSATALVKAADELLDDDPVQVLFLIPFSYQFHFLTAFSLFFFGNLIQDVSYFSSGGDGTNILLDEMDGAGGSISVPPGTPEFHKIRLEMEHIHVSSQRRYYELIFSLY